MWTSLRALRSSLSLKTCSRSFGLWTPSHPPVHANTCIGMEEAIGNTPLILLKGASEATGCHVYAKAEFTNAGGSVKDRIALQMILDAEEQGILVPGEPGVIVEGTAGNTGIGLSRVASARGYRTVICIADTQSQEKILELQRCGAEVIQVPAVPFKNPNNYVHVAHRLAETLKQTSTLKVLYADQWDNPSNRKAHFLTTGPEIWRQTEGKIDAFSCAMGTGGTLTGVSQFLKSQNPNIKIALTDPCGSVLSRYFKPLPEGGIAKELVAQGTSISEGIGQGRITGNMQGFVPDFTFEIKDQVALEVLYEMGAEEGLAVGSSTAINVAGAIEFARELGPGHTVVTLLCDLGNRYASRIYNPDYLKSHGFSLPPFLLDESERDRQSLYAGSDMSVADVKALAKQCFVDES